MQNYTINILDSVDKLLADAEAWNSLWARTGGRSPLVRAECIALWMRRFVPDAAFRAVVVEADGVPVAGIPLYLQRRAKILRTALLPSNGWGYCGDLLCDNSRQDAEAVFFHLVKGLKRLPIDFLWCEGIRYENFPWKNFSDYRTVSGRSSRTTLYHHTAVVPLHGDPETVAASWDKKELADIKRRFRKRYTPENHEFRIVADAGEIAALLPGCFEMEHAGWKGREGGGSIVKQGMEEYFSTQARLLAEKNLLRLYMLFVEGRPVAFQYDYLAGKTVYCMKIGYDPAMREFAPGMVLQWLINQTLLEDPNVDRFDFTGVAGPYQKIWNPELHAVGQVVFPLTLSGKTAFFLYNKMKSRSGEDAPAEVPAKTDES